MPPIALWITGLPGSGKSTYAEEVKRLYPDFVLLRMDELRKIVTPEPVYSDTERDLVYRCLVYTADILVRHGHSVLIDATGNLRKWRDLARGIIRSYGEIHLKCPVDKCMEREAQRVETHGAPADIYSKGKAGGPVPGVNAPYEEPQKPELIIETDKTTLSEAIRLIDGLIKRLTEEQGP